MIKNFIKLTLRNLARNRVSSIINIAGLAFGIASVILIYLYVNDELSYDKQFSKSSKIYQVNLDGILDGTPFLTGNTPASVGAAMQAEYPEIESYVRIYMPGETLIRKTNERSEESFFTEKQVLGVDSNFLQVFTYKVLKGDAATPLHKPNSLVLTETSVKKYFGDTDPVGKTLLFGNDRKPFLVTAVIGDVPSQVSWPFDMITSISSYPIVKRMSWSWVWLQVNTYVKLKDNVPNDPEAIAKLEQRFPEMVKKHAVTAFRRIGKPLDEFFKAGGKWDFKLQPLADVHLYSSQIGSRIPTLGNIKYIYIFSIIAAFIILLACVNFMNLSTAQSAKRAKEVGIRKVLGSARKQLIRQFLAEAMVFSIVATIIAYILVALLLQPFNAISGKSIGYGMLFSGRLVLFITALTLATGLLAGSYPAFYLTSFQPTTVLKGWQLLRSRLGGSFIRNGLVVLQFTISTGLIVCTMIIFHQLQFLHEKNLGYEKDHVLMISNTNRLGTKEEAFRQQLTEFPWVTSASIASGLPVRQNYADTYIPEPANDKETIAKEVQLPSFITDENYITSLGMTLLSGRDFSTQFNDSLSVILNESAVKQIGWKDPVGRYMNYPGGNNAERFQVIGVVKDFNTGSLIQQMSPFALFYKSTASYSVGTKFIAVKFKPRNISGMIGDLEKTWKSFSPDTPFDYNFLDEEYNALYRSEQRMGTLFSIVTGLSIFIACLGLFGLAAYTMERRTKEIGIRKVLGASVKGLVGSLSKNFALMILLSTLIAFPLAWWGMDNWLQDFAYRVDIGWMVFAQAGLIALLIAMITVSFHAIRAASANPVKSLRTE